MLLAFPLLGLLLHSAYSATTPEILAGLTVDNPALADLTVTCAHTMGGGLEARSCFNAWHYAPNDPLQEVFLPNDTPYPSPPGTVIAPKVVFSSKLRDTTTYHPIHPGGIWDLRIGIPESLIRRADDTTCAIVADTRAPSARASSFNVSEAARAIIMRCVIPRRLGGYAQHIGT